MLTAWFALQPAVQWGQGNTFSWPRAIRESHPRLCQNKMKRVTRGGARWAFSSFQKFSFRGCYELLSPGDMRRHQFVYGSRFHVRLWQSDVVLFHLRELSLPSSWHLSLGRRSFSVGLIKASTVWLMNRLCGISAPGWCSHSAALRLLWGPPFHWALNQETALITLPPSSSSPHPFSLSSTLAVFRCSFFPILSLHSTALFLCLPYLVFFFILPPSLLSCLICGAKNGRRRGGGGWGRLKPSTIAYITAECCGSGQRCCCCWSGRVDRKPFCSVCINSKK